MWQVFVSQYVEFADPLRLGTESSDLDTRFRSPSGENARMVVFA